MKHDTCEKDPKVSASIFFFQLLARPPCPSGFIVCQDGWVRGCIRTPVKILQKFVLRAEPWLYAQKEPSLPPLNWGTRVWTTRPASAGVSCKRLCFWGALCLHVPVPPPPPGRLPCLVFWNSYFFPFLHTAFVFCTQFDVASGHMGHAGYFYWQQPPTHMFPITTNCYLLWNHFVNEQDCRQPGGQVHVATHRAPRIGLDRYVGLDECLWNQIGLDKMLINCFMFFFFLPFFKSPSPPLCSVQ